MTPPEHAKQNDTCMPNGQARPLAAFISRIFPYCALAPIQAYKGNYSKRYANESNLAPN